MFFFPFTHVKRVRKCLPVLQMHDTHVMWCARYYSVFDSPSARTQRPKKISLSPSPIVNTLHMSETNEGKTHLLAVKDGQATLQPILSPGSTHSFPLLIPAWSRTLLSLYPRRSELFIQVGHAVTPPLCAGQPSTRWRPRDKNYVSKRSTRQVACKCVRSSVTHCWLVRTVFFLEGSVIGKTRYLQAQAPNE